MPHDKNSPKNIARSTPRLYVETPIIIGGTQIIDGNAAQYLFTVMRLDIGDAVKIFDNINGEFLAHITAKSKRHGAMQVSEKIKDRENVANLWLCQAAIKRDKFDLIAEKSCELGVDIFQPIITQRCVVDKIKPDRLASRMIEAAEQCERTALPQISDMMNLTDMLKNWDMINPAPRHLFFADERSFDGGMQAMPMLQAFGKFTGPAAILIGPEGGFTDSENALLRAQAFTIPISLGPLILRAETAAMCAISVWMAAQ
ncbi:16S rRNA (uracil(1498)-N(3))-methyltransferase [Sphingorhabdus lutea]|uniref:Ribosomal RNA small subunit methyltransferase E n=1 Tax=Sphingorhabdus lutea TaxID=1913578 RepID=A0A1L3JAW7_9SPHN|nr:16S rRNA (uracil(1498)-N(3))-methyltransferase [Sphingorhabdus lutea]APG62272.1 16S rRNA (uracil(1498)-N(3))-methyltransferase [Sphingorhabdus lutea]